MGDIKGKFKIRRECLETQKKKKTLLGKINLFPNKYFQRVYINQQKPV